MVSIRPRTLETVVIVLRFMHGLTLTSADCTDLARNTFFLFIRRFYGQPFNEPMICSPAENRTFRGRDVRGSEHKTWEFIRHFFTSDNSDLLPILSNTDSNLYVLPKYCLHRTLFFYRWIRMYTCIVYYRYKLYMREVKYFLLQTSTFGGRTHTQ